MTISFLFKTWFFICFALLCGLVYFGVAYKKGKLSKIDFLDFSAVSFSSLSVIGGLKLALTTFIVAYKTDQQLDMNSVYTTYGGIAVIWIAVKSIIKKYDDL